MSVLFTLDVTIEKLSEELLFDRFEQIYKQDGFIDFVIDRTVDMNIFADLVDVFDPLVKVEKLFLAKPVVRDTKAPLVLLRILNDSRFRQYIPKIIEVLLEQKKYACTRQIVVGWGSSIQQPDKLKTVFQRNLIAKVENSSRTFLMRWYDPRVQYIFQNFAPEILYQHYLKEYENWEYLHPKGIYRKQLTENNFKFNSIYPQQAVNFLMMSEDVNCINKYIEVQGIPTSQIDPMKTYEHLIFIKKNKAELGFNIINDLVFWFYKTNLNLLSHNDIKPLWDKDLFEQLIEKLSVLSDSEIETLKKEIENG